MTNIVLASASPRRIEMFRKYGYTPEVIPADIEETIPFPMSPESTVMYLALQKADHVFKLVNEPSVVISADTVVVYNNEIMGKPADESEAYKILNNLKGTHHQVITGVCVFDSFTEPGTVKKTCLYDTTEIYFKDYTDEFLREYIKTSEPYDKAGGYAIQGTFGKYIDHIEGDMNNVIGFPFYRIEPFIK